MITTVTMVTGGRISGVMIHRIASIVSSSILWNVQIAYTVY